MATFNDLVRVIAEVEGMDPMTVRGIGIKVRETGMISKNGRGLSAARMTVEDAAALLIGVNGTAMAKDAAEAVQAFRDLRLRFDYAQPEDLAEWVDSPDVSEPMQRALKLDTPFGKTLAALIADFIPQEDGNIRFDDEVTVRVEFNRPIRSAGIRIYWAFDDENQRPIVATDAQFESSPSIHLASDDADRTDSTTIGERTLRAVGRVLAT